MFHSQKLYSIPLFWRVTIHISIFKFLRDSTLVFLIQCFPKLFSHRILRLGIKYSIKYLLGKLLNVSHEVLNDLDSAPSSAIIPNPQPPNILLYSLAPLKHLLSALGPSSSCCFSPVFFKTCFKSHFCRKPCPTPPMCFHSPPRLLLSLHSATIW